MSVMLVSQLTWQTKLSRGNPNMRNLIEDFDRLGINVRKAALGATGPATIADTRVLDDELLDARNQLLHGEVRMGALLVGTPAAAVNEHRVNRWVQTLDRMADTLDSVVSRDLTAPLGARPW